MRMYMFVLNCLPDPNKREYADLSMCLAHIWVKADNENLAFEAAKNYAISYGWLPQQIEHAFDCTDADLSQYHEDEVWLCRKAEQFGIAADYIAAPKVPRDGITAYHLDLPKN